jgi:hypothetical protein
VGVQALLLLLVLKEEVQLHHHQLQEEPVVPVVLAVPVVAQCQLQEELVAVVPV